MCELSIIVPVYNVSEWLEQCLNSILMQTYTNFEVICVDDGSTDNSLEILRRYECMDDRVKVIHKENGGQVSARKAGVSIAKGEYATCVDSDDWIDKDMYECLMARMKETKADIITSGLILEYPNGSIIEIEEMPEGEYAGERLNNDFYPHMISTEEFFVQNVSMHIHNKIYKTELLKKNQSVVPDTIKICEDAACVYPCFLEANKIVVMHKAFYHYRMRESSLMGGCETQKNAYRELYEYLEERLKTVSYDMWKEQLCRLVAFVILMIEPDKLWKDGKIVPYHNLKRGKMVLYGMGRFGKAFRRRIENLDGYDVVALVDSNRKKLGNGEFCYTLEELVQSSITYDWIVITILKRNICRQVKEELIKAGVKETQIIEPVGDHIREFIEKEMRKNHK